MNPILAIIVQAANIRGSYLHGSYYYGIEDCCECTKKIKELLHAHFLLDSGCLTSTECVTYPFVDEVNDLIDDDGQVDVACGITLAVPTPTACSDLIITKVVA